MATSKSLRSLLIHLMRNLTFLTILTLSMINAEEMDSTGNHVTFYPSSPMLSHNVWPLIFFLDTKLMHLTTKLKLFPQDLQYQSLTTVPLLINILYQPSPIYSRNTKGNVLVALSFSSFSNLLEYDSYLRRYFQYATGLPPLLYLGGRMFLATTATDLQLSSGHITTTLLAVYRFPCDDTFDGLTFGLRTCPARITLTVPLATSLLRFTPWAPAMVNQWNIKTCCREASSLLHCCYLKLPSDTTFFKRIITVSFLKSVIECKGTWHGGGKKCKKTKLEDQSTWRRERKKEREEANIDRNDLLSSVDICSWSSIVRMVRYGGGKKCKKIKLENQSSWRRKRKKEREEANRQRIEERNRRDRKWREDEKRKCEDRECLEITKY